MAKTFVGKSKEQQGHVPRSTCKMRLIGFEIGKTPETWATPKVKMYTLNWEVVLPKELAKMRVRENVQVGTEEDPRAKQEETWDVSSGGPARVKRLINKSGADAGEDDEEWTDQFGVGTPNAIQVVIPVRVNETDRGTFNNLGLYYRETDDDCPPIGIDEGGGGKKGRPARTAPKGRPKPADDDEDEEKSDEESPKKRPKGEGKKRAPADDDDDDD